MAYNKEENNYYGWIYKISNNQNNKVYIGQTRIGINERWLQHLQSSDRYDKWKSYLHKSMKAYGKENFKIEKIEEIVCNTEDELKTLLNEKEIYYIDFYNSLSPNGYNLTRGGQTNVITNEKPVCQYDLEGNFINKYESSKFASIKTGVEANGIRRCCRKIKGRERIYSSGGYIWRFEGDDDIQDSIDFYKSDSISVDLFDIDNFLIKSFDSIKDIYDYLSINNILPYEMTYPELKFKVIACCDKKFVNVGNFKFAYKGEQPRNNKNTRQVLQLDKNNNCICKYISMAEASRKTNISKQEISKACRNLISSAGGYYWKYDNESCDYRNNSGANSPTAKPVLCVDLNIVYPSASIASKELSVNASSICGCCKGNLKTAGGYRWMYAS